MASVFWDSDSVLMIDYLEREKTVTGVYCLLDSLSTLSTLPTRSENVVQLSKKNAWRTLHHGVLLHRDNAPAHTSAVAVTAIQECGFLLLNHPPYLRDLTPSDYHVLRFLKDSVRGRTFNSVKVAISEINDWFEQQDKKFFMDGVISLAH